MAKRAGCKKKLGAIWRANEQNSVAIQHANKMRSGHDFVGDRWKHGHKSASVLQAFLRRLSENTTAITFCNWKTKDLNLKLFFYFFLFGSALCKSGRAQARTGRVRRRNMPSWNTDIMWQNHSSTLPSIARVMDPELMIAFVLPLRKYWQQWPGQQYMNRLIVKYHMYTYLIKKFSPLYTYTRTDSAHQGQ